MVMAGAITASQEHRTRKSERGLEMRTVFAALAITIVATSVIPANVSAATFRPATVEKAQEATKVGYYGGGYNNNYYYSQRSRYHRNYYYNNGC